MSAADRKFKKISTWTFWGVFHGADFLKLESEYVKNHLEGVLTELLAELYLIRPADPIEWLSCALRQYARREEARKGRSEPSNSEPADGTALTTE